MPSHDFIHDLLEKIESQSIHYYLVTVEEDKETKKVATYTSLESNDELALIKFIKKTLEKEIKSKNIDKS